MKDRVLLIVRESHPDARVRVFKLLKFFNEYEIGHSIIRLDGPGVNGAYLIDDIKLRSSSLFGWVVSSGYHTIKYRHYTKIVAVGLDSAIGPSLLARLFRSELIFDNPDNVYRLYNSGAKRLFYYVVEVVVSRCARRIIVPASYRVLLRKKTIVLPNFPYEHFELDNKRIDNRLHILLNGWVSRLRGKHQIDYCMNRLNDLPHVVWHLVGANNVYKNENFNVRHYPNLNGDDSLELYQHCDLVIALYDPSVEINRQAAPNKFGDAIFTNTLLVTNYGLDVVNEYFPCEKPILINYSKESALYDVLKNYYQVGEFIDYNKEGHLSWKESLLRTDLF